MAGKMLETSQHSVAAQAIKVGSREARHDARVRTERSHVDYGVHRFAGQIHDRRQNPAYAQGQGFPGRDLCFEPGQFFAAGSGDAHVRGEGGRAPAVGGGPVLIVGAEQQRRSGAGLKFGGEGRDLARLAAIEAESAHPRIRLG